MRVPARLSSRLLLGGAALLLTSTAAGITAFALWRTGTLGEATFWAVLLGTNVAMTLSNLIVIAVVILRGSGR